MALNATIYNVAIELAHIDRAVYETLALRVARHPSESEAYLLTRLLAYCLEYTEGIAFSRGLSEPDAPALAVHSPNGELRTWIEVGTPDAARLHRASKAAPRVAVYVHKDPTQFLRQISGERIHRAEALEVYAVDRVLLDGLTARLDRRMSIDLSVLDGEVTVLLGGDALSGAITRCNLNAA